MNKYDKVGNVLNIGDKIAYAISLGTDLHIGTINRFTNKLVYINCDNYTAQRYPNKVVKI